MIKKGFQNDHLVSVSSTVMDTSFLRKKKNQTKTDEFKLISERFNKQICGCAHHAVTATYTIYDKHINLGHNVTLQFYNKF